MGLQIVRLLSEAGTPERDTAFFIANGCCGVAFAGDAMRAAAKTVMPTGRWSERPKLLSRGVAVVIVIVCASRLFWFFGSVRCRDDQNALCLVSWMQDKSCMF